jgi:hypothetical protein
MKLGWLSAALMRLELYIATYPQTGESDNRLGKSRRIMVKIKTRGDR